MDQIYVTESSGGSVQSREDLFDLSSFHSMSTPTPYDSLIRSSDSSDASSESSNVSPHSIHLGQPLFRGTPPTAPFIAPAALPSKNLSFSGGFARSSGGSSSIALPDHLRIMTRPPLGSFDGMNGFTRSLPDSPSSPDPYSPPGGLSISPSLSSQPQFPSWSVLLPQLQQQQQQQQQELLQQRPVYPPAQTRSLQYSQPPLRSNSLQHLIVYPPAKPTGLQVMSPDHSGSSSSGGLLKPLSSSQIHEPIGSSGLAEDIPLPYTPPLVSSSVGYEDPLNHRGRSSFTVDVLRDSSSSSIESLVSPTYSHPFTDLHKTHFRLPSAPDFAIRTKPQKQQPPQPFQSQPQPQPQPQHVTVLHVKPTTSPGLTSPSSSSSSSMASHPRSNSVSFKSSKTVFSVDSPEFSPTSPALQAAVAAAAQRNSQKVDSYQRQVINSLLTKLYPNEENPLKSHAFDGPEWQEYYEARSRSRAKLDSTTTHS